MGFYSNTGNWFVLPAGLWRKLDRWVAVIHGIGFLQDEGGRRSVILEKNQWADNRDWKVQTREIIDLKKEKEEGKNHTLRILRKKRKQVWVRGGGVCVHLFHLLHNREGGYVSSLLGFCFQSFNDFRTGFIRSCRDALDWGRNLTASLLLISLFREQKFDLIQYVNFWVSIESTFSLYRYCNLKNEVANWIYWCSKHNVRWSEQVANSNRRKQEM